MSADLDFVERAVVLAAAVVLAVVNCTADVLVCEFGSHNNFSLKANLRGFRRKTILTFEEIFILSKNFQQKSSAVKAEQFFGYSER